MKPLTVVYWSRVGFGIIAALACTLLRSEFLTGLSFGILFYIVTYYLLKPLFLAKVEKSSELVKMGIGAYFLSWILAWALFFTLMHPTAVFTYSPEAPVAGETITFNATRSYDLTSHIISFTWYFGDGSPSINETDPTTTHAYNAAGNYTITLTVTDNEGYRVTLSKSLEVKETE